MKRPAKSKRPARRAPAPKPAGRTPAAEVRAAQERLSQALREGNRAALGELLSRDFSFVDAQGRLLARPEFFKELATLAPGPDRGVKVRDYGRVALVTGRRKSARKSGVYFVTIWVQRPAGWRALIHQDNVLAGKDESPAHAAPQPRPPDAKPPDCDNPLKAVPYRPQSAAEREIIKSFQQLETAVTRNDADAWMTHMADEFVVTRTRQHPTSKAQRAEAMRKLQAINAETWVAEVESMRLWVLGDAAVMQAQHRMPGDRRPPYRAVRIWVKRDGRWQMALSQQTTISS
jgi:ketosteroid isomerase-like protein